MQHFSVEEVVPTSVKQASFGRMVALIVRPAKSEGGGKIGGQGLGSGAFSLGRFLRACLLIMYFRCLAFCTDLPRWQCGTMRGEEKYAAGSTKDAFNYFICPAFFIFNLGFLFDVISFSNIRSMFQIGFVWQAMWIQSKPTAVIQKLPRKLSFLLVVDKEQNCGFQIFLVFFIFFKVIPQPWWRIQ